MFISEHMPLVPTAGARRTTLPVHFRPNQHRSDQNCDGMQAVCSSGFKTSPLKTTVHPLDKETKWGRMGWRCDLLTQSKALPIAGTGGLIASCAQALSQPHSLLIIFWSRAATTGADYPDTEPTASTLLSKTVYGIELIRNHRAPSCVATPLAGRLI